MTKECKSQQPSHVICPRGLCGAFWNVVVDWKEMKNNLYRSALIQSPLWRCWTALALALSQVHVWGWTCWTGCWPHRASKATWMWSASWSTATMRMSGTVPSTATILLSSTGSRCMLLHKQVNTKKLVTWSRRLSRFDLFSWWAVVAWFIRTSSFCNYVQMRLKRLLTFRNFPFFLNSFFIKCKLISISVQGITKYNLPQIIAPTRSNLHCHSIFKLLLWNE